jgi:tryptophan 6-halogenase
MNDKKIMVVGGGTAGWMVALIIAHALREHPVRVELVESPEVGIIGVGEGSTPALKSFFNVLNISEQEWMPACNATYKCGIRFIGWSTRPGFESYFHPFASGVDDITLPKFVRSLEARMRGADIYAHPDGFFLANYLAQRHRAPKPAYHFPFSSLYGYHFDAGLLGNFLRTKAVAMGIAHRQAHIADVRLNGAGDIAAVVTRDNELLAADFFVDCTGFRSLLLQQALGVKFISFADQLFNDAAVTLPSDIGEAIPSETLSTALSCGWAWKIPLTNRFGNGYVYSSSFCSADQAETELRKHLGLLDSDVSARHLAMKVGQVEHHWQRNCVAVGLAQGFIEPLEATALYLVQQTAIAFANYFAQGDGTNKFQAQFNQQISANFEGVRDYIVSHYKTSSRTDSEYWRANTADPKAVSGVLRQLYSAWFSGQPLDEVLKALHIDQYYPAPSWYCLLAGMGMWGKHAGAPRAGELESGNKLDDFFARCCINYPDHRQYLQRLAASVDRA